MMEEIWKNLKHCGVYNNIYEVSSYGRVRRNGRIRVESEDGHGYLQLSLWNHCKQKVVKIHRLVALAFVDGYKPGLDVNHIDGNKHNNHADNLEWVSRSENISHAYRTGLRVYTEKQRKAARKTGLSTKNLIPAPGRAVIGCAKTGQSFYFRTVRDAFRFLGATLCGAISACCRGKKKTYKGMVWKYAD